MSERQGRVEHIFTAVDASAPMISRSSVQAIANSGLEGDRYANGVGAFSHKTNKIRQVSLIAIEDWVEANKEVDAPFTLEETRRNIVTSELELNNLIGEQLHIGEAILLVTGLCSPCNLPNKLAGKSGFYEAFTDRGGLRAQVLQSGLIQVGDNIAVGTTTSE